MEPNTDEPKAPGSKPDTKDDLKYLPVPEVEKKLGRRRTASVKPRRKSG